MHFKKDHQQSHNMAFDDDHDVDKKTHYLVNTSHEELRQFFVSMSPCRLLILVVC